MEVVGSLLDEIIEGAVDFSLFGGGLMASRAIAATESRRDMKLLEEPKEMSLSRHVAHDLEQSQIRREDGKTSNEEHLVQQLPNALNIHNSQLPLKLACQIHLTLACQIHLTDFRIEKVSVYQKEYEQAFREARILSPSLTRLLNRYDNVAPQEKMPLLEQISKVAKTPKEIFLVNSKKALIVSKVAFDYCHRFYTALYDATDNKLAMLCGKIESVIRNIKKLEKTAISIVESAKKMNNYHIHLEEAVEEENQEMVRYLKDGIEHAQASINYNVFFAKKLEQGHPTVAGHYNQAAQFSSLSAQYSISLMKEVTQVIKNRLDNASTTAQLTAFIHEKIAEQIEQEGDVGDIDYYKKATDYYGQASILYALGEEELAANLYSAGASMEDAASYTEVIVKARFAGDGISVYCYSEAQKYFIQKAKFRAVGNINFAANLNNAAQAINKGPLLNQMAAEAAAAGKSKAAYYYRKEADCWIAAAEAYAAQNKDLAVALEKKAMVARKKAEKGMRGL